MERIKYKKGGHKRRLLVDSTDTVSDGFHTFGELYAHRIALFVALCRMIVRSSVQKHVWRSKKHHPEDQLMYEGWFIIGIHKEEGKQMTYHLPLSAWEETNFAETLGHGVKWDGHSPEDVIQRLKTL